MTLHVDLPLWAVCVGATALYLLVGVLVARMCYRQTRRLGRSLMCLVDWPFMLLLIVVLFPVFLILSLITGGHD